MMINDCDCDVEEPTREDFWDESTETALYVISQARLSVAGMYLKSPDSQA
jgi:hypothetical protein